MVIKGMSGTVVGLSEVRQRALLLLLLLRLRGWCRGFGRYDGESGGKLVGGGLILVRAIV